MERRKGPAFPHRRRDCRIMWMLDEPKVWHWCHDVCISIKNHFQGCFVSISWYQLAMHIYIYMILQVTCQAAGSHWAGPPPPPHWLETVRLGHGCVAHWFLCDIQKRAAPCEAGRPTFWVVLLYLLKLLMHSCRKPPLLAFLSLSIPQLCAAGY